MSIRNKKVLKSHEVSGRDRLKIVLAKSQTTGGAQQFQCVRGLGYGRQRES